MNENILVVEDEQALRNALGVRLRSEGYVVDTAEDGNVGLEKATNLPFDLIILDVMLPYQNGLDVCRSIRQMGLATPILMLTVRDQVIDKVVGLKLGADDYMTKPFDAAELVARIEALLRRSPAHTGQGVHQFGSIVVDVPRGEVTREGKQIYLTGREFQLLYYLIERAGSTVPRSELLRSVWGYDSDSFTRTVDAHIASLRQKLEDDPKRPELLLTVFGVGYKFAGVSVRSQKA
ncbi:MAG TPA: response regulator transcription factor [Candidatus Acidoferrum sp.]|jgi:two-component system, OmpR family, alkaline phosphatase synthesis response regulator PhoP|nr:response regulator transcription factor [Candidatus Acidoferrum sp.]